MSDYNFEKDNQLNSSEMGIDDMRPAPLYGVLVCAIIIVIVGVVLIIKNETASGYLPQGRGMGSGKFGSIPGPLVIILGILLGGVPLYYLIKIRRKRSNDA